MLVKLIRTYHSLNVFQTVFYTLLLLRLLLLHFIIDERVDALVPFMSSEGISAELLIGFELDHLSPIIDKTLRKEGLRRRFEEDRDFVLGDQSVELGVVDHVHSRD